MAFPTSRLRSSWEVRTLTGEPYAAIHVRSLQTVIRAGTDAWGRTGKDQPALVTAEVSLAKPFHVAASSDTVSEDTVHYGLLAKAVLASLGRLGAHSEGASRITINDLVEHLGNDVVYPGESSAAKPPRRILRDPAKVRYASLTLALPKASLLGEGVSLTHSIAYPDGSEETASKACCLSFHRLRVPTLIGVNDNERTAKQVVVADVDIDQFVCQADVYTGIEAVIVKTMEESSFETLEALAATLAAQLFKHLTSSACNPAPEKCWQLKIGLEKPTAIPMAQASRVEYRVSCNEL
ncbi:hypothetical protein VD0002_g2140 [Verticillium dahliae]|uniref:Dihydroneopterin aldolase/epimerase domain-containing protein n=1 Tax=Verticillium dahliae TaxID=27337 RepID=A0A2J8BWV5_VERDA|nr:TFIIH basal transcription factor complex p47 subunit [Verticillium dahliae VDG2]KAH6703398.1 Dihydroneopterin aldolase-domain-containing protein [Verticillium dahliae]PNH29253.1 hypothetical protein BJF96_g7535 [Verticillium dahliae]PNH54170.1 hypothetical protein VD0003_g3324 [Verticillium dahliae]PNH67601.1 hypothetical protein VD0002_g2140 [Verticillium dahliae]